jgi:hypothetical protein
VNVGLGEARVPVEHALSGLGRVASRQPHPYATSWPLEELTVRRFDGRQLALVVKHVDGNAPHKPQSVADPDREAQAYELLADERLGTPRCYASGSGWLALERIDGVPLWQVGEVETWAAVAAWAAALHRRFAGRRLAPGHLLEHDRVFYARWHHRCRDRFGEALDPLSPAIERAIARLTAMPKTLIHGELYPSNVILGGERIAVIDWEMAALGPGVIDLAALSTGWVGPARETIVAGYGTVEEADLAAGQLVLALQWLGWSEGWRAPPEHRRDWLAEAYAAARVLV